MAELLNFIGFKTYSRRIKNSFSLYSAPFALLFTFSVLFCVNAQAQEQTEEQVPENLAPPAIKVISKEEKSALASISDIKNRTKLTIELMEARLKKAEALNAEEGFSAILNELGGFQALMNDAFSYINRNGGSGGKMLDTFKRFEMALRAFMPRIELIRREMPDSYGYHVKKLLISVRDARSKAVAPLFSTTVVPNNEN